MKLSPLQQRFLSQCTLDAAQSVVAQAATLKVSSARLQHALTMLFKQRIVRVAPLLDRVALGYTDYHIFFSVAVHSLAARDAFVRELAQARGVVFFAEIGGDFHYELIVAARSANAAASLLDAASEKHRVRMQAKSIATGFEFRLYNKRYLAGALAAGRLPRMSLCSRTGVSTAVFSPDHIDEQLLRALSTGEGYSLRDLGRLSGLTHTAVRHRLGKLREHNVLRAMYYDVEPLEYGYQDFVLQFTVAQERKRLERQLFAVADKVPEITYAASYFGAWDFEVGLEVEAAERIISVGQQLSELLGPEFLPARTLMRFRQLALRPYPF